MDELIRDCHAYCHELMHPGVVSRSHETLQRVYFKHGRVAADGVIQKLLDKPRLARKNNAK